MGTIIDFQFAKLVRERYRQRTAEAAIDAQKLLAVVPDFSVAEEYPVAISVYATTRDELRERWRLRLKAELLIEKLHGRQVAEVQSQLTDRYQRISRQAVEMKNERLCVIYLNALAASYDPHSSYLKPGYDKEFNQITSVRNYTFGTGLRQQRGYVVINSVRPELQDATTRDSLVGWRLIAIRRLDGTIIDLVEMHLEDVVDIIRSPSSQLDSDTEVILELMHPVTLKRVSMSWNRIAI